MVENVKPIPDGFRTLTPYLIVKDAAGAIEFYKKAFAAQEIYRDHGPDGKSIIHAELKIGDSIIMLNDEFPDWHILSPKSFGGTAVTIHMFVEDAEKVFNKAITSGAKVVMPLIDAFWGDKYGQIEDPFGHKWSIATHKKDMTREEIRKAIESMMPETIREALDKALREIDVDLAEDMPDALLFLIVSFLTLQK